jgi:hypothetical protein
MNLERTVELKVPMFNGGPSATPVTRHMEYRDLWYWIASDVWDVMPEPAGLVDYDPGKDPSGQMWRDLKAIEVLSLRAEYDEETVTATAAAPTAQLTQGPGHGPSGHVMAPQQPAAPSGPSGGAAGGHGVPVLKIHLVGTTPHVTGETPPALNQLIDRLKQKGYFQQVQVKNELPAYKDAPGYPYEKERPKAVEPKTALTEGATAPSAPAGTETAPPAMGGTTTEGSKVKPAVNPWRGEDYWFELVWHVNLKDVGTTVHVDYSAGTTPGNP